MVKSRKNRIFDTGNASDEECIAGAFSIEKSPFSPSQEPEKTPEKHPYCVTEAQKGACMRTGLTKQEKTTDIWFDEKDPLISYRSKSDRYFFVKSLPLFIYQKSRRNTL